MKIFVVMHRMFLALAVCAAIGVGGMTLAHHAGKGHVKVAQLSQRDIVEKVDGKDAGATVVEVTFEPGQEDSPHRHAGTRVRLRPGGRIRARHRRPAGQDLQGRRNVLRTVGVYAPGGPEPERQDQDPPARRDPALPSRQGSDGPGKKQKVEIAGLSRSSCSSNSRTALHIGRPISCQLHQFHT
jgi:hypothetical protein